MRDDPWLPDSLDLPRALTAENLRRWARAYLGHMLDLPADQVDLFGEYD